MKMTPWLLLLCLVGDMIGRLFSLLQSTFTSTVTL